ERLRLDAAAGAPGGPGRVAVGLPVGGAAVPLPVFRGLCLRQPGGVPDAVVRLAGDPAAAGATGRAAAVATADDDGVAVLRGGGAGTVADAAPAARAALDDDAGPGPVVGVPGLPVLWGPDVAGAVGAGRVGDAGVLFHRRGAGVRQRHRPR